MFFKKASNELDILPPPPPFPELKIEDEAIKGKAKKTKKEKTEEEKQPLQKPMPKIKHKTKSKNEKKQKAKSNKGLEQLRKTLLKKPKQAEEQPNKILELQGLGNTPHMPEIEKTKAGESSVFDKKEAKQKAKEEKKRAKEERKKQKKAEKELAKQKRLEERQKIIEEKTTAEKEESLPELESIKIEKPAEIFQAEQEINKAITGLKKKQGKSLFSFLKTKKEKLPEPEVWPEKIPKEEPTEKLPVLEIKGPTDEVNAIKHKIHDARTALMNFDLQKAKILYIKTMRLYQNLSPEKQAIVYNRIKDLYNERMHAEGLKFKK